jgi:hypothetical protein
MIKYDQSWRYHENITGDMQPVEWGDSIFFVPWDSHDSHDSNPGQVPPHELGLKYALWMRKYGFVEVNVKSVLRIVFNSI